MLLHEAEYLEDIEKAGYLLRLKTGSRLQAHGESSCSCIVELLSVSHIRSRRGHDSVLSWLRTKLIFRPSDCGA